MKYKYKRVVVKIGSNVLARKDGGLDVTRMSAIVDQVAELYKNGVEVIMISSGAVASGRSELKINHKLDSVSSRQLFSAVGQVRLVNHYWNLFKEHDMNCGQVLTTKENFSTRRHYLNQQNCMEVMLSENVVPIVNENDTISVTELMFTDNDELSGLISAMMGADALVILSNIDGIYNGNPSDDNSFVIREVEPLQDTVTQYVQASKSQFGRGGMITKCRIAMKVADEGIEVIIANGKRDNILLDLLKEESDTVSTRFKPAEKPASGMKKWIAHSEGFAKGVLVVNDGARDALLSNMVTSLLPVGVDRVEGDFEKDDIVKVVTLAGKQIAVGRVSCDSETARKHSGEKGGKPFIHYDFLCIE